MNFRHLFSRYLFFHSACASFLAAQTAGKGKRCLNRRGVVDAALGGWQLTGIGTVHSGLPFTLTTAAIRRSAPPLQFGLKLLF